MNAYEIMFIVSPLVDEATSKKLAKEMEKVLTDNGAKITESTALGLKEFAYEIKKQKNGYYFLLQITNDKPKALTEFERLSLINENILRHLIIKKED
jgi:small subunit ribosomal protein S6